MQRENIDGEEFALATAEELNKLREFWETLSPGTTTEDVGQGIWLFYVDGSVQFRVRVDRSN